MRSSTTKYLLNILIETLQKRKIYGNLYSDEKFDNLNKH